MQLLSGDKVSLLAVPSNVSECRVPIKKVLAGWELLIYKLPLLCGVSVEPAGKKPRSNVSQEQTCRLEQVLTTLVRGMV